MIQSSQVSFCSFVERLLLFCHFLQLHVCHSLPAITVIHVHSTRPPMVRAVRRLWFAQVQRPQHPFISVLLIWFVFNFSFVLISPFLFLQYYDSAITACNYHAETSACTGLLVACFILFEICNILVCFVCVCRCSTSV